MTSRTPRRTAAGSPLAEIIGEDPIQAEGFTFRFNFTGESKVIARDRVAAALIGTVVALRPASAAVASDMRRQPRRSG